MCREMEIMRNQAYEEGVEIGIKKGRMLHLIKQVCAKMQKFSSAEEIANDLVEQDVPLIQKIMDVAPNFGPDYNVDAIYKAYSEYLKDKYIRESQWNAFISNLQHQIKSEGDLSFIRFCITSHFAERCFLSKQYDKGLYVVATVDYLCRISNIPLYSGYDEMRKWKLEEPKYPEDIEQLHDTELKEMLKRKCMEECLPEFKRANIMEKGVRHVI